MKLGRKNLFYSVLLAAVMLLFLVGYFSFMLPSLYVAHMKEQNLQSVKNQHKAFVETGSYDGVSVKNPVACVSMRISLREDYIALTSKMISLKIIARDAETRQLLQDIQTQIQSAHKNGMTDRRANDVWSEQQLTRWLNSLEAIYKDIALPFDIQVQEMSEETDIFHDESYRIHAVTDTMIVVETSIWDSSNEYTNYMAVEKLTDSIVFTLLPVVTPAMGEITPIVFQSLPMLGAVILALVLVFSQIYSRGIVTPILKLVRHTEAMREDRQFLVQPLGDRWNSRRDEIGDLVVAIDEMYQQIKNSYQELQRANQMLLEENERQEVFLRASSHQLKTPVTAALLLVDGMINQVGKYRDVETYLKKVKVQLLSMRHIIEEILSLNRERDNDENRTEINLPLLLEALIVPYQIAISEKHLTVTQTLEGTEAVTYGDAGLLSKILDNLIANAVNYTPYNESIYINISTTHIKIRNQGVQIPQELLPHIFEPFVRGNHEIQSNGLGLYIAAYYAKLADAKLTVKNGDHCVESILQLDINFHRS